MNPLDERRLGASQAHEAMMIEILHALGLTEALKICVRRIGMVVDGEQAALDQIRLNRTPQSDRQIGLPHGKVEIIVGEDELHIDLRIEIEKLCDAVGQPDPANADGRRNLEISHWLLTGFGQTLARHLVLSR
jgi:hypothetical protein